MNFGSQGTKEPVYPISSSNEAQIAYSHNLIAHFNHRIDIIEEEIEELDQLDMEHDRDLAYAAQWSWRETGNDWRIHDLEDQYRIRAHGRQERMKEIDSILYDISRVEDESGWYYSEYPL